MKFQCFIFQALKVMENCQITNMVMESHGISKLIKIVVCVLCYSVLYQFPILTETMSVLDFSNYYFFHFSSFPGNSILNYTNVMHPVLAILFPQNSK